MPGVMEWTLVRQRTFLFASRWFTAPAMDNAGLDAYRSGAPQVAAFAVRGVVAALEAARCAATACALVSQLLSRGI
jgi:hypothetical protein